MERFNQLKEKRLRGGVLPPFSAPASAVHTCVSLFDRTSREAR
nr:MAG TPA: hypothetical protein [Caudoviricetes sp.]